MNQKAESLDKKFYIGQKVSMKKVIKKEDVEKYAELTGDFNSLHINDEIAKKSIFGKRVCHGMLVSSYISTLLGMYLPGDGSIYLSQDLKFIKPVYMEEEIEITVEISEIFADKNIILLNTFVTKDNKTLVISGNAKILYQDII